MPASFLKNYPRLFYFNLRCKDGKPHAPRSLIGIRAGIHRYLTSPKVNRKMNILTDAEFTSKKCEAIEKQDMIKLRQHFDRRTPERLQQEVWFNVMYYFGFRGREMIAQLEMCSFNVDNDEKQRQYLYVNHQTLSKNVKASLSQKEFENLANASCMMLLILKVLVQSQYSFSTNRNAHHQITSDFRNLR